MINLLAAIIAVLGLAVSGKERIIGNGEMMDKSIETTQALLRCFGDAFEK